MTWSHLDSVEVSQKQSRILGDGLSWPKQVMLDARTQGGAGRKKTTEFARYDAEVQYFEAVPQKEYKRVNRSRNGKGEAASLLERRQQKGGALILKAGEVGLKRIFTSTTALYSYPMTGIHAKNIFSLNG